MSDTFIYRNAPPGLLPLYARALMPKPVKAGRDVTIPALSARLLGASTAGDKLARYKTICGFTQTTSIPVTWPHVMAFPLHLKLLTAPSFPLPLLGLVHLRNTITQHRAIGVGETLDLTVRLGKQERTSRGIEFDLITEAHAAGKLIWEESSITLYRRAATESGTGRKSAPPGLERYPNTLSIDAPESIGRQYAGVSGDSNPIHMHALSAKAFGFPRAIAHGMWSKARALALLEQQEDWKPGAFRVSCQFKKPLFLPGTAQLNWHSGASGWDYQLLNSRGDAPHLSGRIDWL
ncbi:MaoC/PaaZ C-terminal domain-containing protein [Marinobacter sp. M216]|uniref:MaoC/PaaZ C-terminal domain-containing protein n=1 Tax=Marinobacter albus TaxID=3030833 RepID=A0ABT7HGF4_9GAMM|nr:MaoC/PaaZ C-terminal domain-containing protein [Marinobacter sp. M216]MDK9559069.1 MaoC/PaaZ C-terminal domain-containing protein [Marinobacter sp. M216]